MVPIIRCLLQNNFSFIDFCLKSFEQVRIY